MKRFSVLFLIFTIFFSLTGCAKKERIKSEDKKKFAIEKEFHKGGAPITVRIKISSDSITIADILEFVIELEQGRGVKADIPPMNAIQPAFGNFLVRDFKRMPEQILENGTKTSGISYILEPQLSGKYEIQPFVVPFYIEGDDPPAEYKIETEKFEIEVRSLGAEPSTDIKPIQGPVAIPSKGLNRKKLLIVIISTIGLIIAISAVIMFGKKRKKTTVEKKLPAHIIAMEALKRLREKKLIEQGLIKDFYYEISNIMRHYIEGRFGISAPEQTTEEFLLSISRDSVFDSKTKNLLASFLEHCDMVKYARYAPETAEIKQAFNVTRDFIEATKQENKNGV